MPLLPRFRVRGLAVGAMGLVLSLMPVRASQSLAERIVLTPQSGETQEDQEIRRWQDRVRLQGAKAPNFERLAWAYVAKARRTLDAGYYKLAQETAAAMEERFGVSPESRLIRGHVLHNLHRFQEAETLARQLAQERGSPNDFGLLSDVLMEQGKLTEAVAALQQMVNLRPGIEAYGRIAHLRWLKGDLPGAIEAMEQAVRAGNPRDKETYAWTLVRLAGYQLQAGQIDRASLLTEAANKTAVDYAPALLMRGRVLLAQTRTEEAVTALKQAASLNPLPEYQWWLADALRASRQESQALAVESDLKLRGEAADPRTLALFLATRGAEPARAVTLAREELVNRQDPLTRDALAWALARQGDLAGAAEMMQAALAEKTQDARLLWHAGEIALAQQQGERAQTFFREAQAFAASLTPSERSLLAARSGAAVAQAN